MSSTVKKVISREDWDRKLSSINISKSDLNKLVMNYLVIEGYKDAAECFTKESGELPTLDLASIEERMRIRSAIQSGDVRTAIELVNDLNPEILDTNPALYFQLQLQHLIELIRSGDIVAALDFAQDDLAPRGEDNPDFLADLESTMALLAFENCNESPLSHLLETGQRQKTASGLNAAILASQCQQKDPKLPLLLKMLVWAQNQLSERGVEFPQMTNLATAAFADDEIRSGSGEGAGANEVAGSGDPMVT